MAFNNFEIILTLILLVLGGSLGVLLQRYILQKRFQTKEKKILDRLTKDKRTLKHKQKEIENEIRNELRRNRGNWEKEKKKSKSNLLNQIQKAQSLDKELFRKNKYFDSQIYELEAKNKSIAENTEKVRQKITKSQETMNFLKETPAPSVTRDEAIEKLKARLEINAENENARYLNTESEKLEEELKNQYLGELSRQLKIQSKDFVTSRAVLNLPLPDDKMKGQIIGREGRNIRTLETITGTNIIVDETPSTVIISGFSPVKKEIAKQTLEKLIEEGKINPQRIEEVFKEKKSSFERSLKDKGFQAAKSLGLHSFHPELLRNLGRLSCHTYLEKTNLFDHVQGIVRLAESVAKDINVNPELVKRGAFLHLLGHTQDFQQEGSVKELTLSLAKKYNESGHVLRCLKEYDDWTKATSVHSFILALSVDVANKRPGSLTETLKNYLLRQPEIEKDLLENGKISQCYAFLTEHHTRIWTMSSSKAESEGNSIARDMCERVREKQTLKGMISAVLCTENKNFTYHLVNA